MDFTSFPHILKSVSEDLEPKPRSITVIADLLELAYNLLEHPILKNWQGFEKYDPFKDAIDDPERFRIFNRTIIERTISHCRFYHNYKLDNGVLTMRGKGIELLILTLRDFMESANNIYKKTPSEISAEYSDINFFRLITSGELTGVIISLLQTSNEFILLTLKEYLNQSLKKEEIEGEKIKLLLRWQAEIQKNKDQYADYVYNGITEFISIELNYFKQLKESLTPLGETQLIIEKFLAEAKARISNQKLLTYLLEDDLGSFKKSLAELVLQLFSYHDISGNEPEKVYHGFLLGVFNTFSDFYKMSSNKEAGLGRFDILLAPNTLEYKGVIIEVKRSTTNDDKVVKDSLQNALTQIINNKYYIELKKLGVSKFYGIAIVFYGKEIHVEYREYDL